MSTPNQNFVLGPFTKENFNQAQWKHVTDKLYHLNPSNEQETIPDCKQILQLMMELDKHPDYNEYFGDPAIKNYFFREFFINNAKYLIATKNFHDPHILRLSNAILQEFAMFWIKAIHEDHPKLTETAKIIFDIERAYFKINDQENVPTGVVSSFLAEPTQNHLDWIESLKIGDWIDCVKLESHYKKMCWSHAQVINVSEAEIMISYKNEKDDLNKALSKSLNANEMAPFKTRCKDFEWRESLKVGDQLDACDTSNVWYNVTVLDTREKQISEDKVAKEVYIGYRIYDDEQGDRYDPQGRKYSGWSAKYDEWLNIANPRLSKKGTMAKKLYMGSSSNTEDPVIDDSNDRIYSIEGERVFGITREKHCKSTFIVKMVNNFGQMKGFDKILERINNTDNWAPIEVVSIMVTLIGNLHSVLHRDFALEYIPKLKEAVWRNLLKSPESNIRNFTKERIDNIIQAFDALLKRVYSLPEKNEMIETLTLDICSICFDSKFLERKLQGLKSLLEVVKNTKFGHAKFITTEYLNDFIERNQIFDKIFGLRGHTQLIQRSSEFLKFLIGEGNLSPAELEVVWSSTRKGDTETKLATYKVLSDLSVHLQTTHLDFLIEKIALIPADEMIPEEIDLIYELNRLSSKASGFTKKALDFYWKIITDSSNQYSNELIEFTLTKYSDIMRGWDLKDERMESLHHCLDNIDKGFAVLNSLKIMKKLIDQYPATPTSTEKFTKRSCIEHLCSEKKLLTILMRDLKSFKEDIRKKVGNLKEVKEEDLNSLVNDRAPYLTAIGERLQFILYIFANNETGTGLSTLTYEHLSELWDIMVNEAFLPGERDVVYKWIKETAESKSGFPMSSEDLLKFFQEKINNAQNYENMTIEGFNCVKNLFLIINEKLEKISKIKTSNVTAYQSSHNGYGVSYHSYSYNYEETKAVPSDFEYQVNVLPEELEGIQSMWNFIFDAQTEEVTEKAIDFLNRLYLYVKAELEEKITSIRTQYLSICFKYLQDILNKKNQTDSKDFTRNCLRCLSLIRSIMDESEKKGIGNLKAHSGLVKGELLSLTIVNELTMGSDVPKKVEIKIHSNTTVYGLRVEIGKQLKATWDQVKLSRYAGSKEIKDNENGKTLGDIRIRNGEGLIATKRATPPIAQANLLNPDDSFTPEAKAIFVGWFNIFSENGKMNADQCAAFIHSCTNDNCKGDDKRVKDVFATYDNDHDGFLTLDNFLEFYFLACKQRPSVVWSNLSAHHYRNDLKKVTEVEEEKIDVSTLSRYIISQNKDYFYAIFSLLDCGGTVANEAWKLLNRLPTSSEIFENILVLKGVKDASDRDWSSLLDSSSTYKLLYSLHVLEYLMEDNETEKNESKEEGLHWYNDPKLLEQKKNWRVDFIAYGGFDHLFRIFNLFSRKDHATLNLFEKNIISFVLKILKNYLTATFASTTPYMYRSMSFIKLLVPLDFISNYINSEQHKLVQKDTQEIASEKKTDPKDSKLDEKRKEILKIEETQEFKVLVERLRGDLGNQILSKIDLKEFVKVISTLSYDILQKNGDFESEDRMILEFSVSILVAILLHDKTLIKFFLNIDKSSENYQDADKYIIEGIFCPKSIVVRRYYSHALYILCKYTTDFENAVCSKYMINLFLRNLPSSDEESKKDCHQYFELLCKLIEETYSGKEENEEGESAFNFEELIAKVVLRIKDHASTEKRQNLYSIDRILIGLLNLCDKLLIVKPNLRDIVGAKEGLNLPKELFEVCLFHVHEKESMFNDVIGETDVNVFSKDYVKCKSRESRTIAYKLLNTLCKNHPSNLMTILESLKDLMITIFKQKTSQVWNYSPSSDTRSLQGYAGIKNLGCICYMNAMLQQFFMTPAFRYAILAADDKKEPNLVNKDNKFMIDDNVLHQLQQMFGFLELTDRRDYNPHEFCFAFKDFTGAPVNVSEQQDTQEFLNTIFDRLENGLKQTPFRHILEGVYGGKTSNQIICHGCKNVREKEEPFYNMSVEVRNMKTVFDSFEQFITGETIEDYNCEACQQKNSITKRTCLSYLPNVLIVHLKRIVFDLDTLMNQKINSRLEFPFELDMEPYTAEGLAWREKSKEKEAKKKQKGNKEADEDQIKSKKEDEDDEEVNEGENQEKVQEEKEGPYQLHPKEYYQYRLAGVVVHIGTAEIGHYYSYININRGENGNNTQNDKWLEFNDSLIKDFDIKNIEKECFGGAGGDSSDDYWGGWSSKSGRENSKNAYILVYERVAKDPLKFVVDEKEDETYLNKVLNIERILRENPGAVNIQKNEIEDPNTKEKKIREIYNCDYFMLKRFIPSNIYKKVWEDNHKFMFERHIYNEDFFKFFKDVCNCLSLPNLNETLVNFIYTDHVNLSPEVKLTIRTLVSILSLLIFYILAKSDDNKTISELSVILKNLLSLAPEAASYFFDNIVCKNLPGILELFMNCPEKQVRQSTTQIVLHSINIMIAHHGFTLSVERLKEKSTQIEQLSPEEMSLCMMEDSIIKFLQALISYIPTEVAKNWTKFAQYFEFWRDFALSGEVQMAFLYSQQFIAILGDFYLEKKSPLVGFSEKKHSMGNRYAEPDFNALLQTISHMVQRAQIQTQSETIPFSSLARQGYPLYPLSENDWKVLTFRDFYEKSMRGKYNSQALGIIIQQLGFENEVFCYHIADIILKGVNKATFDDSKPYLEAMVYFLNIIDFLQLKRIEWVLGFPQPTVTAATNTLDSFGLYGNSSIEDFVCTYETPIIVEGGASIINYMLQNRKRLENITLICLKNLLTLATINQAIFEYILFLPPPSNNYAKFTDWIDPFFDFYFAESKKYSYTSYHKEELATETLKMWKSLEAKIESRIDVNDKLKNTQAESQNESQTEGSTTLTNDPSSPLKEGQSQNALLRSINPTYIIGKTISEEHIDKILLSQPEDADEIYLETTEVTCYITQSKPTGKGNLAFPEGLIHDGKFKYENIDENSTIAYFIKPKSVHVSNDKDTKNQQAGDDIEAAMQDKKVGDYGGELPDDDIQGPSLPADLSHINLNMKYPGSQQGNEEFPPIDNRLGSFSSQSETQEVEYGVPIQGVQSKTKDVKDAIMDVESPEERKEDVTEIQTNKLVSNPLIHEIEGMNYEVAQMIRRFILVNTSSFMVYCQLAIFAKTNDLLNFRIPVSIFNANIKPKSKSCILCLTKFDPTLPWGEYEVKCHIQLMEAPAEPPKSENDSGKKKGNIFQIRPIDLYNAASNFEYTDEDFYTEFFSK